MNELWRDPTTNQCYLIPEGTALQSGDLELVNSNKERKLVQQEAVQSYACSATEANQHIQERVTQMLELALRKTVLQNQLILRSSLRRSVPIRRISVTMLLSSNSRNPVKRIQVSPASSRS